MPAAQVSWGGRLLRSLQPRALPWCALVQVVVVVLLLLLLLLLVAAVALVMERGGSQAAL